MREGTGQEEANAASVANDDGADQRVRRRLSRAAARQIERAPHVPRIIRCFAGAHHVTGMTGRALVAVGSLDHDPPAPGNHAPE